MVGLYSNKNKEMFSVCAFLIDFTNYILNQGHGEALLRDETLHVSFFTIHLHPYVLLIKMYVCNLLFSQILISFV